MPITSKEHFLEGVKIIIPFVHDDDRGFFTEIYNERDLDNEGINFRFIQENHSISYKKNTLRGLHAQIYPFAQTKLVRCGQGSFLDIFVDIRKNSSTFMQWGAEILSEENKKQILIPDGFLHGFLTHEDNTEIIYKCTNFYSPDHEISVTFDDHELNINWGIENEDDILISEKDRNGQSFKSLDNPF